MGALFVILGLIIGAWAVRSICVIQQSKAKKFGKSVFAAWYFLTAGGMGNVEPLAAIVLLLLGLVVVNHLNKSARSQNTNHKYILSEHISALNDFDLVKPKTDKDAFRSSNFATGKGTSGLTYVDFNYVNASGESSFRDVDVMKFDGQYVEGYCHLSRAFKTSRIDRIEGDMILRDTGECIDANLWAAKMSVSNLS